MSNFVASAEKRSKISIPQTDRQSRKTQAVSLEITHNCIAKCVMCNIWKIPVSVPDLKAEEWLELLSSPLFFDVRELDITGGEPFLRKDLFDIFSGICKLTVENLKSLKSIAITIDGLSQMRQKHPNLIVGLKTTILPQNIDQ